MSSGGGSNSETRDLVQHIYNIDIAILLFVLATIGLFLLLCCTLQSEIEKQYKTHVYDLDYIKLKMRQNYSMVLYIHNWVQTQRGLTAAQRVDDTTTTTTTATTTNCASRQTMNPEALYLQPMPEWIARSCQNQPMMRPSRSTLSLPSHPIIIYMSSPTSPPTYEEATSSNYAMLTEISDEESQELLSVVSE